MKQTLKICILLLACMLTTNLSATYYLVGNGNSSNRGAWCSGKDWGNDGGLTASPLENNEISYSNLPAQWYEFKVTEGSWDTEYNYSDLDIVNSSPGHKTYGNGGNICFRLNAAADVNIRMADGKIILTIGRNYTIVGNGSGDWLGGQNWGNINNHTIINSGNSYSRTFYNIPAGNGYKFRVKDYVDSWDNTGDNLWGHSRFDSEHSNVTCTADNDDNICFNLGRPADLTISLVENKVRVNATAVYFITGNGAESRGTWCDQQDWKVDNANSRLDASTLSKTYTNLPAGEYQFKISNGAWPNNGGTVWNHEYVDFETSSFGYYYLDDNNKNVAFTLTEAADVTIHFDPATEKISLTSSKGYFDATYHIVGDPALVSTKWSAGESTCELTDQNDGTFQYVEENKYLSAGSPIFKLVANRSWDPGSAFPYGDGNNAWVTIPEDGVYTLTYTFNPTAKTLVCNAVRQTKDITISEYGYSTFYSNKAYSLPDGLRAIIFTGVDGDQLTAEEITVIPALTGVLLQGTANANYALMETQTDATYEANMLQGTLTQTEVAANGKVHYVLGVYNGDCGLYWPYGTIEGVGTFTNKAEKAYLEIGAEAAPARIRGFVLSAPTVATGVEDLTAQPEGLYYDMLGRIVREPQPGQLYIHNGKKIMW